jgi:hypothetical protein
VYPAKQAMLRIVTPTGAIVTAAINGVRTADLFSLAHVSDMPGKEIFLQVQQTSSGAAYVAYSFNGSRLISAGVGFSAGGDSADANGFACLPGNPPRVIERNYQLIHGIKLVHETIFGLWNEEVTNFAWHGLRLVVVSRHSFVRRLVPKRKRGHRLRQRRQLNHRSARTRAAMRVTCPRATNERRDQRPPTPALRIRRASRGLVRET